MRSSSGCLLFICPFPTTSRPCATFYCLDLTHDTDSLRRLTDDELGEAARSKFASPIRRIKVNASPFVCPLWEIGAADLQPADEDELMRSAQSIQSDEDFLARLIAAARTTDRTYPPSDHVELQIYGTGWPSDNDLAACRRFHETPWEMRLDIALGLADMRYRRLGRRLVYFERPDLLRPADRSAFDDEVVRGRAAATGSFLGRRCHRPSRNSMN
jgi:exodeoxyribonuclease-1